MPRKQPSSNDSARGERLLKIRKKIWGSRNEFSTATGIPAGTLEGWEKRGIDISCYALAIIAKHGGDVVFVLTGEHSDSATAVTDVAKEGYIEHQWLLAKIDDLEKQKVRADRRCEALLDELVDLREKLAGFTGRSSGQ
jgi:hypothetical protein